MIHVASRSFCGTDVPTTKTRTGVQSPKTRSISKETVRVMQVKRPHKTDNDARRHSFGKNCTINAQNTKNDNKMKPLFFSFTFYSPDTKRVCVLICCLFVVFSSSFFLLRIRAVLTATIKTCYHQNMDENHTIFFFFNDILLFKIMDT